MNKHRETLEVFAEKKMMRQNWTSVAVKMETI